ncbi:hypothetical protein GGR92_003048 [Spirosoma lacussanchae]
MSLRDTQITAMGETARQVTHAKIPYLARQSPT